MKAIPFVASIQREIYLFKLLGIFSAVVGGIVEEVFFRRWIMDMFMSGGFAPILQVIILRHRIWFGTHQLDATRKARLQGYASGDPIDINSGIFVAILYLAGGRNLGPWRSAHVLINIVIEPWLMLSAVSGKWRA